MADQNIPVDPTTGKTLWWCETRGGQYMCLPRFLEVAGWFKGVQRAVNAVRAKNNLPPIRVDARIGPETTQAVSEATGRQYTSDEIAANAQTLATDLAKVAGVNPDLAPDPRPQPQEIPTPVPPETVEEANKKGSKWKWWLIGGAVVVVVGGAGYWIYRRQKMGQPLFAGVAGVPGDGDAPQLGDGDDYEDEAPPPFRNVIDV